MEGLISTVYDLLLMITSRRSQEKTTSNKTSKQKLENKRAYVDHFKFLRRKILDTVVVMDFDSQRTICGSLAKHMLRFEMHMVDLANSRMVRKREIVRKMKKEGRGIQKNGDKET